MSDVTPSAEHPVNADAHKPMSSKLLRGAIWIAIGALIAAALVCVVWVLVGDQDGLIGRAFLTILLLALFAGVAIAEAHLAERRPDWLALSSMISWIVVLLVGAVKIWLPRDMSETFGWAGARFFQFLLVNAIQQLALVHVRLFTKASRRYVTTFTRVIVIVTFAMLAGLVALLVFHLTFPEQFRYDDLYWRIVVALAILTAVGTTLIPLLNALFAPRAPRPARPVAVAPQQMWPTYADGRTPLPALPDGSPDLNAYYTGRPTYAPQQASSFPTLEAPQHSYGHAAPAGPQAGSPTVAPRVEPKWDDSAPFAHVPPRASDGSAAGVPTAPPVPPAPPAPPAPHAPTQSHGSVSHGSSVPNAPYGGAAAPGGQPAPPAPHDSGAPTLPPVPPVPPVPPAPPAPHDSGASTLPPVPPVPQDSGIPTPPPVPPALHSGGDQAPAPQPGTAQAPASHLGGDQAPAPHLAGDPAQALHPDGDQRSPSADQRSTSTEPTPPQRTEDQS
ncbi:MAG: hypothetical protein VYC96_08580 [Actinomycetota bacterium]|nr:hypothetical protein [Actinomycetota bacterium]